MMKIVANLGFLVVVFISGWEKIWMNKGINGVRDKKGEKEWSEPGSIFKIAAFQSCLIISIF